MVSNTRCYILIKYSIRSHLALQLRNNYRRKPSKPIIPYGQKIDTHNGDGMGLLRCSLPRHVDCRGADTSDVRVIVVAPYKIEALCATAIRGRAIIKLLD
ncbi:hypothetical protein TNCV_4061801 [Trichonephila clavipes]|nr:hypothetical protein TNCV_4061801 [Trichonephila clavipes]